MNEVINVIQYVFVAIEEFLGWLIGGADSCIHALIVFVVMDYITGTIVAYYDKKLSSKVGTKGILKKVLIFFLVGIGHIVDTQIIKTGSAMRTAIIFFYLSNEGISILENAALIGVPIPEKLKSVLVQLRNKNENNV